MLLLLFGAIWKHRDNVILKNHNYNPVILKQAGNYLVNKNTNTLIPAKLQVPN